ncbi:MAG: HD domain-containing protein, partial [Spirochaetota bacterium]
HDLGHTPFGHAGEDALAEMMAGHGGFEHNRQGLRVVELLETKNPEYPGLNLTWEVRDAMAKHSTLYDDPAAEGLEEYRDGRMPSLEGQVVEVADSIAYDNHDLDDGLRSGLIEPASLGEVELWRWATAEVHTRYGPCPADVAAQQVVRLLINAEVTDLIDETTKRVADSGVRDLDDVRNLDRRVAGFSALFTSLDPDLQEDIIARTEQAMA